MKSHNFFILFLQDDFAAYESEENFAQTLIMNLDGLLSPFKETLTPANFDSLVTTVTVDCNQRWEKLILKSSFNRVQIVLILYYSKHLEKIWMFSLLQYCFHR